MTSSGHMTSSVTLPIDSDWPLSYRLPIVNSPRSPVVSEIFSVTNGQTDTHAVPNATQVHTPTEGWGNGDCVSCGLIISIMTAALMRSSCVKTSQSLAGWRTVQLSVTSSSVPTAADCFTMTDQQLKSFEDRRPQFWSSM